MQLKQGVINQVPVGKLKPDPNQPRQVFDEAELKALAASMKNRIEVPLNVRLDAGKIVIVDGERRWRAAKLAKIDKLPCILVQLADVKQISAAQLATAVRRENLKPIEIGEHLLHLRKTLKLSNNQLFADLAKLGIQNVGPAKIETYIQLTELPEWAKRWLRDGTLAESHGAALLHALKFPEVLKLTEKSIRDGLQWKGGVTAREVQESVEHSFARAGVDLTRDYGDEKNIRQFPLKVCDGCEFLKKIGRTSYCMNPAEFRKKNDEALVLKAQKEAKKEQASADRPPTAEEKREAKRRQERMAAGRYDRTQEYFDAWLRPKMRLLLAGELSKLDENAFYGIALWLACGAPLELWSHGIIHSRHDEAAKAMEKWAGPRELFSLPEFIEFSRNKLDSAAWNDLVNRSVECMTRDQVRYVAALVGFDLKTKGPIYRIDETYLAMKRKNEMCDLAKKCKGIETVANLKGGELRALLLQPENREAIGVPDDIAEIFALPYGEKRPKNAKWGDFAEDDAPTLGDVQLAGVDVERALAAAVVDEKKSPRAKRAA